MAYPFIRGVRGRTDGTVFIGVHSRFKSGFCLWAVVDKKIEDCLFGFETTGGFKAKSQ
jgi:hypothetical protein